MTFERAEVARWLFWGKGDNVGRSGDSFLPLRGQQQFPHPLCLCSDRILVSQYFSDCFLSLS